MTTISRSTSARVDTPAPEPALPRVLAIVVTHRGRPWLRDCLIGLANQEYPWLDILVVDDASPDSRDQPALRRIAKRHLRKRRWGYLRTPRPLGFGGAINWALSRVRTDVDMLLFLHDDAAMAPGSLGPMVEHMLADGGTAIVGPKVVSWEDSARLEEVGMAADRFGYPYKGLEEGEIDLGQHDRPSEVFYVTSTCMLVRHSVFRQLNGWDSRMRAFTEDLDLCWRARVAGHSVHVEPRAKVRHAIALATGQRRSPFLPTRYFIRRNRLRTVTKNASGLRLLALIPQYLVLALIEMLAFIVLREPREIFNVARALLWNFLNLPQTLAERTRVQRRRKVSDRKLRRLTVRESTRMRAYLGQQRDRLEGVWGRRAEVLSQRGVQAREVGRRWVGVPGALLVLTLLALAIGFRHILWTPPPAVGEILPFPTRPTGMLRAYLSSWQAAGLGSPWPTPPAFALLGFIPLLVLGATGAAQKILIIGLGSIAFAGAARMLHEVIDRPARVAGGLVYAFGAVGYAGTREARLGALVFGAAAPFVLGSMLRLIGWIRPPAFRRGRAVAQVTLGAAVSAAFVPGSLLLYLVAAGGLAGTRSILERGRRPLRGVLASIVGLVLGWALLLPWSAGWFGSGGAVARLVSDDTWRTFASTFSGAGTRSIVLGQTPDAPPLFGLALPILGLVAVLLADGNRRRVAIALWSVVAIVGLVVDAIAGGVIRPLVPSPTEAGVLASLAYAGLAGLAVAAFRLDLARRTLGLIQPLAIGALAVAAFLMGAGLAPALVAGAWDPTPTRVAERNEEIVDQVGLFLQGEVAQIGQFRTLWVGPRWTSDRPMGALPAGEHIVTGPHGQVLTDLFQSTAGPGERDLDAVIGSVASGRFDRAGRLLGAFNIAYVVLESGPDTDRWLGQRDLQLIRTESDYMVLSNEFALPRAAVFAELPPSVRAIEDDDVSLDAQALTAPSVRADQRTASAYRADSASGPGVAWLAEAEDPGWGASLDGTRLERVNGGWGNAFELPSGPTGRLEIRYPFTGGRLLWLVGMGLAWVVVVGAAFSSRGRPSFERRVSL